MIKFVLGFLSIKFKKKLALALLADIDKNSVIDNRTAEDIMSIVAKSGGNKITAFIVRD